MQASYERELKQTFNNINFIVRAGVVNDILFVEVEQENNQNKWRNQFTKKRMNSKYILNTNLFFMFFRTLL